MDIESSITSLVAEYNKKYSNHPIVVFDFVSLDNADDGKLMWWTYNIKELNEQYKELVLKFIGTGESKQTLIKMEFDRDAYLYKDLGVENILNRKINGYHFEKNIDPIGIDDQHINKKNGKELTDRDVIEAWERILSSSFGKGSTIWVSLPHTDKQKRKIYSAVFVLFNSQIVSNESKLHTYRAFRDFIVTYLIELYKAPIEEQRDKAVKTLAAIKKSNNSYLQKWIEGNPEFYVGTTIKQRLEQLIPAIQSDTPILIIGETGTGKEHLAKSIHELSKRKDKNYVAINCSGYDEGTDMVSSELFGHEKGAYTGAITDRTGILETYTDGTIFLDEIQQMPISVQKKLKRVLDGFFSKGKQASFRKLGGDKDIHTKARFIFATNQNIIELVHNGKFLDDFFYRINVITITIPPLRERQEEILLLAEKFLNEENASNGYTKNLTEEAKKKLQSYHFPGNVRELRSVLLRAYFLSGATTLIRDTDLHFDIILKHQKNVRLIKPEGLSDETVFKTVCDLYEAHEKLKAEGRKITNPILVKALPSLPYGYSQSSDDSAVRSFKSTWLNNTHAIDLQKINDTNKDNFPQLADLPFISTVLSSFNQTKKSKKK